MRTDINATVLMKMHLADQHDSIFSVLAQSIINFKCDANASPEDYTEAGEDEPSMDVRLQVYPNGRWAVRVGSSDYDQDHSGAFASSSIGLDSTAGKLTDELILQVLMEMDDRQIDVEGLKDTMIAEESLCASCEGHGYLEVTHVDNCEYIEACENCNCFTVGSTGDSTGADDRARDQAQKDGYILDSNGKIKV